MWVKVIDQEGKPVNHSQKWSKELITITVEIPKTHSESMKQYHREKKIRNSDRECKHGN